MTDMTDMTVQQQQQQPPPKPVWKQFSNFANGHPAGIEKTLRLIQAICQILSASVFVSFVPNAVYAVGCASVRGQVALGWFFPTDIQTYADSLRSAPVLEGFQIH